MTGSASFDGLISGLDTTSLINQLMAVARKPQDALKTKVVKEQSAIKSYQSINTAFLALSTASKALADPTTYQGITVSSSSASVAATGTSAASTGSLTFDVDSIAANHSVRSDEVTGLTSNVATSAGLDLTTAGGTVTHIDTTDTSLQGVVDAINGTQNAGVTAAAVKVRDGVYRLQLTASKSGAASDFTVGGLSVNTAIARQGSDASITVGSGAGAYTVTSPTNTFTDVLPGASFTVSKVESGVTLNSTSDADGLATKIQAMIDGANSSLGSIGLSSNYNATTKTGGPLTGDYTVRQLGQRVSSTITSAVGADGSFAQVGLQVTRDGAITFDKAKFLAAYQADPGKAQRLISTYAAAQQKIADGATTTTNGAITLAIQGRKDSISTLNDGIANWDIRLDLQQTSLKRTYANLEVALSKLRTQTSYLTQQLG